MSIHWHLHLTPPVCEIPWCECQRPGREGEPYEHDWLPTTMMDVVIYKTVLDGEERYAQGYPAYETTIPFSDVLMWAWREGFVPRRRWGSDRRPFGETCPNNFTTTELIHLDNLEDN